LFLIRRRRLINREKNCCAGNLENRETMASEKRIKFKSESEYLSTYEGVT
jgi:hypothetical protein